MTANFKRDFGFFATLAGSLFIFFLLDQTPRTDAIPAFARKYQTACSTCHNNYPELNDFGEAFKKNGFKFPKDDESFVKEAPVMLGAKAQKEAFPRAVYPGEIPGTIPIAIRYSGFATINSKQPISVGFVPRTDLFTPDAVTVLAAGSLGQNISFWIDDDISVGGAGADGGLGEGYIKFNDLGHYLGMPKDALNLKVGQFELDLPFTQARGINLSDYDIYGQGAEIGGLTGSTSNPFLLGESQRGIEFGGYPNDGNFAWSAAVVNGNNDGTAIRDSKDIYLRVSQRFNLDRDPASRKEIRASGPTGPHDHTSLRLGAFYYYGRNALNLDQTMFPGFGTIVEPFYRVGADFRFKYQKFELYGLAMHGYDKNLFPNPNTLALEPASPVTFSGGFAEAEYWFYPWVIGTMRYDVVNSPTDFQNGVSDRNTRNRFSPGMQFLVRDNIKASFEYQYQWRQPDPATAQYFRANGLTAGIDYVF
jgi:hypothetical protein